MNPISIYNFITSPYDYFEQLKSKWGDPFPLQFPNAPTVWMTSTPELIKSIFTSPADSFVPSEYNPVSPLLGPFGLIMMGGQNHLHLRRELSAIFSKNGLAPHLNAMIDSFKSYYESVCDEKGLLHLQDFSQKCTLRIILKILFPHLISPEIAHAENLTSMLIKSYSATYLFIPKWVPGFWKNFLEKKQFIDDQFYNFFQSGIECNFRSPLARLKENEKSAVSDHIRTFIVAGHETSATALTWTLFYLHQNEHVKNRLCEELEVYTHVPDEEYVQTALGNLYLENVINEAMRLRPPVPFITRKIVNRDFLLGEKKLAPNEELGVCIGLLHHDEKIWGDPSAFRPERFFERKHSGFEFAPFGGGTRKCLGAELAMMENKVLIALFLKYFNARLINIEAPGSVIKQITAGPKRPIEMSYIKMY